MRNSMPVRFLSLANQNRRIGAMCLGFVACLIGSPMVFIAVSDVRFLLGGETVNARIVGPAAVVPGKFGTRYRFRFQYADDNGQQHLGEVIRRASDVRTGETIAVRYLRSEPSQSRAESELRSIGPHAIAMIVILVFVAAVYSGLTGIGDVLKQLRANGPGVSSALPG